MIPLRARLSLLVLMASACAVLAPASAADKPVPPAPPNTPGQPPPAPPPHPGLPPSREFPGGGQVLQASGPDGRVQLVPEGVGFDRGGHTATVEPGKPLRARVLVESSGATEAVVTWKVDGDTVGQSRALLLPGRRTVLSPLLPTGKPGRYVVEADVLGGTGAATSYTVLGRPAPGPVPDEVVAVLDPTEGLPEKVAAQLGIVLVRAHRLASGDGEVLATYRVPESLQAETVVGRLRATPGVRSADRVGLLEGLAGGDLRSLQYAPSLLEVPRAHRWALGRGVPVAVVDTGVDTDHPELAGRVELVGDTTSAPYRPEVHGTAVAGLIAAGQRMLGIAPSSRILSVRACTAVRPAGLEARCRTDDLIRALDLAVRAGARVVNASLGGPHDQALAWMVRRVVEKGVLVVAAAGNGGRVTPVYPAALPGVVAVGATDRQDRLDPTTATGSFLSLVAPGVDVLTAFPGRRYVFVSGTSFAAAHVSGAAALVVELSPGLSPAAVRTALERGSTDLGPPGFDPEHGWGRLSACRPLELVAHGPRCR